MLAIMSTVRETPHSLAEPILIIGAGLFGLTQALELAIRGYEKVTVLDRMVPPVPDGSSVDFNRVIRYDYADPFYGKIAQEAMKGWTSEPWDSFYHNTGFVMASEACNEPYIQQCRKILKEQKQSFTDFDSSRELARQFPVLRGGLEGSSGYINPSGGWANAEGAIKELYQRCIEKGVSFMFGQRGTVTSLLRDGETLLGVHTLSGPVFCSKVILSTGAWTNRLINATSATSASGQPVGFVQLTAEEAKTLEAMPVVINLTSGVFIFPPTPETHLLKVARHSHGFEIDVQLPLVKHVISAPNLLSNNAASSFIPDEADAALKEGLRYILPQFADRPFARRRLCWYSDTPKGDFLVDNYPGIKGLFVAAGGAGQ